MHGHFLTLALLIRVAQKKQCVKSDQLFHRILLLETNRKNNQRFLLNLRCLIRDIDEDDDGEVAASRGGSEWAKKERRCKVNIRPRRRRRRSP